MFVSRLLLRIGQPCNTFLRHLCLGCLSRLS